ncbi:MAG: endonuclease MutS2 [Clostridia bacterium]|nr:endonuclease MutS2 [Clostridia bacterium]
MNRKAQKVLEYYKIINILKEQAASAMTKEVIEKLQPVSDSRRIKDLLAETTEAVSVIVHKGALPLGNFYDIDNYLHLARKGGSLTMKQLLEIRYNLAVARNVVTFLKSDLPPVPIIKSIAEVISVQKKLEEDIERCILSEDEMADNASPELRSIRRSIVRQNESIRARMNQIMNSQENKSLLQDSIVTMRDGRYVIPVKQEHRSRFPGIIHDQSASGSTLFVEPQVIVNLNNELRELELAEKAEIERILYELSGYVSEHYHEILNNQKLLLQLDFIFAKGKLSSMWDATEPVINDEGILEIRKGRHPLIDAKKVVPISVGLGGEYNTLIITGPNTGGKTVTLKTVGLFAVLTQSGLHVPAAEGTKMPVYANIFADIGDEQSIEQSLSTFSSHMNNIVDIVSKADEGTLVLIDELGAGTDPAEGAALAVAILDNLYRRGAKTLATTHYTELKKYAISTPGVENASMEFNIETLSPTYRLTTGTPGKSNAFEISRKLGLEEKIIEHAKTLLETGDIEFESVIEALEKDRRKAEEERDEAIYLSLAIKKQKEELDKERAKLDAAKEKILAQARHEAREIIRETKELSSDIQKELRELSKIESLGERTKRFDENRRRIKNAESKHRDGIQVPENRNPVKKEQLREGSRVKILSIDQNGEVITLPDDKGDLTVQVGIMKINVNIKDLMSIENNAPAKKKAKNSGYGSMYRQKSAEISPSINVQGRYLDDAVMDVDKYLDDAFMAGLTTVTVIHGRGEGILRSGIQHMLKSHKHVKSFRNGRMNEGGDGVTIVQLKEG